MTETQAAPEPLGAFDAVWPVLFDELRVTEHGQLCPYYLRRNDEQHPRSLCNCFVLRRSHRLASTILATLDAARSTVPDRGLHMEGCGVTLGKPCNCGLTLRVPDFAEAALGLLVANDIHGGLPNGYCAVCQGQCMRTWAESERPCPSCGATLVPEDTHWNVGTNAYACPVAEPVRAADHEHEWEDGPDDETDWLCVTCGLLLTAEEAAG